MRLLRLGGDDDSVSLVQFSASSAPPYAVLSHTWSRNADEEVTYQDIADGKAQSKNGFKKIQFCGSQAKSHGIDYFWIDTCCINKADHSELTEAINSMFKWYRKAERCYVYLADVSTHTHDGQASHAEWTSAFRNSRWHQRGWTLQELVAPRVVEFYSSDHVRLGDKKSLTDQIHQITGIATAALEDFDPAAFSIQERMRWSEKRETTKEEDLVYSMLGLFNVFMPLIYGEGRDSALRRLEEQLGSSVDDVPKPTVSGEDAPFIVPFERNLRFTGRQHELSLLECDLLANNDTTTKIAITGLGGMGKTQLALEALHRVKFKQPDCSIMWIPATDMSSFVQAYRTIASQLGLQSDGDSDTDIQERVHSFLSSASAGRWLVVFDNADDLHLLNAVSAAKQGERRFVDKLPKNPRGSILFTTRDRKIALNLAPYNRVELRELASDTALELLHRCLGNSHALNSDEDGQELLQHLTYLPLAIVQACAYIVANGITIAEYLSIFAEQDDAAIELLSEDFQDDGRYSTVKNPIATTWLISFDYIKQHDPLAAEYLSFMACIESKKVQKSLLPAGPSRKKEIDAIGTLDAYCFISKRAGGQAFDLHRLVHLATRCMLANSDQLADTTLKTISRLNDVFPTVIEVENSAVWREYLPHARYVLSNSIDDETEARTQLTYKVGLCLLRNGTYSEAETFLTRVMEIRSQRLGKEHSATRDSIFRVTTLYRLQGRFNEAEVLETDLLRFNRQELGEAHPDTLTSMHGLATTYKKLERFADAEKLFVRAVEGRTTALGEDHPDTMTSTASLAAVYRMQLRFAAAEELQLRLLETRTRQLGDKHIDTVHSMASLAAIYMEMGRLKAAEQLAQTVVQKRQEALGEDHPRTIQSISNLATIFYRQRRFAETADLRMQVMQKWRLMLGDDHPNTISSMTNLANVFHAQDRHQEAEELEVQVVPKCRRALGEDHPQTLRSMSNLAATLYNRGLYQAAIDLEVPVVEKYKAIKGHHHAATKKAQRDLIRTYVALGRHEEANVLTRELTADLDNAFSLLTTES